MPVPGATIRPCRATSNGCQRVSAAARHGPCGAGGRAAEPDTGGAARRSASWDREQALVAVRLTGLLSARSRRAYVAVVAAWLGPGDTLLTGLPLSPRRCSAGHVNDKVSCANRRPSEPASERGREDDRGQGGEGPGGGPHREGSRVRPQRCGEGCDAESPGPQDDPEGIAR